MNRYKNYVIGTLNIYAPLSSHRITNSLHRVVHTRARCHFICTAAESSKSCSQAASIYRCLVRAAIAPLWLYSGPRERRILFISLVRFDGVLAFSRTRALRSPTPALAPSKFVLSLSPFPCSASRGISCVHLFHARWNIGTSKGTGFLI